MSDKLWFFVLNELLNLYVYDRPMALVRIGSQEASDTNDSFDIVKFITLDNTNSMFDL